MTLTSINSTLALGPVASFKIFMATGIFTVSPSGTQMPWNHTNKSFFEDASFVRKLDFYTSEKRWALQFVCEGAAI